MSDVVLSVENVSKRFRIGTRVPYHRFSELLTGLGQSVLNWPRRWLHPQTSNPDSPADPQEFWALQDISFEVQRGEVLGIIGRNGAGKSTLLKILSRITEPTSGRIGVRGRVASLLEVGTGFHPELSGRENIFLSGTLLGMTRAEIKRHFDEIVAFAEIDQFLDTPVKRYSSGMYVRLGFAIAAHLESEILIVDEVLAVGDTQFQKKCLGKMGDVAKSGRTVLFVSHNPSALASLCNRGLLLQAGRVIFQGPINETLAYYQNQSGTMESCWEGPAGDEHIQLLRASITPMGECTEWDTGVALNLNATLRILEPVDGLIFGFRLLSSYGAELVFSLYDDTEDSISQTIQPGEIEQSWEIPANTLASGSYHIAFLAGIAYRKVSHSIPMGELRFQLQNLTGLGKRFPVKEARGLDSLIRPNWHGERHYRKATD